LTFGTKLRSARKAKKLTQKELAVKIKAAHNSISNWENDQNMPDPDTIQNLCWALDVQPNYFFSVELAEPAPQVQTPSKDSFELSTDERTIIAKFRSLDERGKSVVISVLNHEYESLPGEKTNPASKEA